MTEVDRPERTRRPYFAAFALSAVLVVAVIGLTVAVRGVVRACRKLLGLVESNGVNGKVKNALKILIEELETESSLDLESMD